MYAKEIGRNRVIKLMNDKSALLVDMRSPVDFRNGSVDGAINLPLRNLLNKLMSTPRETNLILFSNAPNDNDISIAIKYASEMGFSHLFVTDYNTLRED